MIDHRGEQLSYEFSKHPSVAELIPQLMPHETPQKYGIFERHNRTLLDMGRSTMSTKLKCHYIFYNHALETTAFTLNRAPS